MAQQEDANWHLDKKVPLALLFAIGVQTCMGIWWASRTDARVDNLERKLEVAAPQADRLTRVEVKIENIQEGITEIKRLIRKETP